MIKKRENTGHSLKNRLILVFIVIILVCVGLYNCMHAHKYNVEMKLIGTWNVEVENCVVEGRNWDWCSINLNINRNQCRLPALCGSSSVTGLDEWDKALGTWDIISTNPDSVFFNVPGNPLHGKYAIRFFIDEDGYRGLDNIYKIELQNDSTDLICNKGLFIQEWERKNWESK